MTKLEEIQERIAKESAEQGQYEKAIAAWVREATIRIEAQEKRINSISSVAQEARRNSIGGMVIG
jgi:hypothetical protein